MTTTPAINTHTLARESTLATAEMYAIASIAAHRATERSGYAVVVTADPSIGGISVCDTLHDARLYLRCTPTQYDAGHVTDVRTMTLDIVIDTATALPQLIRALVRAINADGAQIDESFINVDPRHADDIAGYAAIGDAIGDAIGERIAVLL